MDVKVSIRLKSLRGAIIEEIEADDVLDCDLSSLAVEQIDRILCQAFEMGAKQASSPTTQEART